VTDGYVKPTPIDLPMEVASEELTGFDLIAVEKHWKSPFNSLDPMRMMMSVIYVHANRNGNTATWDDVQSMKLKEMSAFFAPKNAELADEDLGKG
jgi:hypothetical protein